MVVADTTVISNLLAIGQIELLRALFGRVLVPPTVHAELLAWHDEPPTWIEVVPVTDSPLLRKARRAVHAGEAEAIALAHQTRPEWLIIDDSEGRRFAVECGVPIIGLLGCLLLAKRAGHVTAISSLLDKLQNDAGFYLSLSLKREVLRKAGEADA